MTVDRSLPCFDTSLSFEERAKDLVSRMTLEEKIWQTINGAPGIERLGVQPHNWWNECLHGVARAGTATVFPQAIGMAASFNAELIHQIATVISDEARARHHEFARLGDFGIYKGLTFWTPNINIFRDPRWGRGQETYGEDPWLTGRIGVAFVQSLQGDDPKYLKVVATPKHYAVHSGPEKDRHSFDAVVSQKDLRETYLPAFRDCVVEAGAWSVMGAYNRTNGEACCASVTLLQNILREEWGFEGYVVSDCGAICDFHNHHKITTTHAESAALAVKNGCDLCCGETYIDLINAVREGLITEAEIETAVVRLFTARMKLGMFDPPEAVPYTNIPFEVNDCEEHREKALQASRESIVLLKNQDNLLPLNLDSLTTIAVVGPNADSLDVLLGNYFGTPSRWTTPLAGITEAVGDKARVLYARGCNVTGEDRSGISEAVAVASRADVVIACVGLSPRIEGEEGDAAESDGGGDRIHISLPHIQDELLKELVFTGKPVIAVLMNGSPLAVTYAQKNVQAIVEAWYPGQDGGKAIADVLFGNYNPSGRLPVTFPQSLFQLPPFEDYSMDGRTYRYMTEEPLYPFGFGLSYTRFEYSDIRASERTASGDFDVWVTVTNTGSRDGADCVQLYISDMEASVKVPIRRLAGLQKVSLDAGQSTTISFSVNNHLLSLIDNDGKRILEPGRFLLSVGGSQGDNRSLELGATPNQTLEIEVTEGPLELPW